MSVVKRRAMLVLVLGLAPLIGYLTGALGLPQVLASDQPLLVWIVPGLFLLLAIAAAVTAYLLRRHAMDWRRVRQEQRLWESGPLGRRWLRRKGRIPRRRGW